MQRNEYSSIGEAGKSSSSAPPRATYRPLALCRSKQPDNAIDEQSRNADRPDARSHAALPEEAEEHDEAERAKRMKVDGFAPVELGQSEEGARHAAKRARAAG